MVTSALNNYIDKGFFSLNVKVSMLLGIDLSLAILCISICSRDKLGFGIELGAPCGEEARGRGVSFLCCKRAFKE